MRAWGSVGHYLQGPGIIDHAARYANLFGTRHLFVVDAFVRRMLGDALFSEYEDLGGSSYDLVTFEGEISRGSIERVRREAGAGHDVIVAVGGGKVIDVAKMLAADGAALVVCPTIAATDAPTSAMSILYSDEGEMNRKGFAFMYSYLKPYRQLVGKLLLGLLLGSGIQLMLPFLTQSVVDFGINNQNLGFIWLVLVAQLVLTFSSSAVEFIRGWILLHLGTRINIALISDFLAKLMRLPMGYFDTKMTGDILQRINDHTRIQNFLTGSSLSVVFSTFNIVVFGLVLLLYSPLVFFIFMGGSALYVAYVWLFMKKRAELDHKRFAQQSANQSSVVQLVTGMQEIKLSACERQKRWEWERIQARLFRVNIRSLALRQYQDSGAVLINQTKNVIITGLVASFVVQGDMTLGMMMSVQYIIGQLNSPVNELIAFARDMQDARLSMNRLSEVRDKPDEEDPTKGLMQEIPAGRDLRMERLC